MSSNLIANRYARALMTSVGNDATKASKALEFLSACEALFFIPESKNILKSPVMPPDLKKSIFAYAAAKAGGDNMFEAFASQVVDAGRTRIMPDIVKSFRKMLAESRGEAEAIVTTADPMTEALAADLASSLSKVFNKKITLKNEIDKNVLGGLVVQVGNYSIDMSLKSRLDSVAEFAQR
jgi:F-type H+-transporting ATPase subunit delta